MSEYRQIEINGIKLEVDMSTARRVDQFRVGDSVKLLMKNYEGAVVKNGIIVEFVNFKDKPTIVIASVDDSWSGADIRFYNYNEDTTDFEMCLANDYENMFDKCGVVAKFDRKIEEKQREIDVLAAKRDWFVSNYGKGAEDE